MRGPDRRMLLDRRMLTALVAALAVLVVVLGVAVMRGPLGKRSVTPTPAENAGLALTSVATAGAVATQAILEPSLTTTPLATAASTQTSSAPVSAGVVQPTPGVFAPEPTPVGPTPVGPTPVGPVPVVPSSGVPFLPPTPFPPPVVAAPRLMASPTSTVRAATGSTRPTLSSGARGAAVEDLQRRLNRWITATQPTGLAPLMVDGIFGSRTATAVRAFQQTKGLLVDGIVGPQTWRSLLAE